MTTERTEVANLIAYTKTDEVLREEVEIALAELGARMARASVGGDTKTVDLIKGYWRTRQTWRYQS